MATTEEKVKILIEAEDKASAALKNVGDALGTMGGQAKTAADGTKDVADGVTTIGDSWEKIAGVGLAITGIVYSLSKVVDLGQALLEIGAEGAAFLNVQRSFDTFAVRAGEDADAVLTALKVMSNGMMSEEQLMEQYNKAYLLMGPELASELPKMIQIAMAASAAGLGSFEYTLNSLTTGLGRVSPRIIDNTGLVIKASEAYDEYSKSIGKSATDLTAAEKSMALWIKTLELAEERYGDLDAAVSSIEGTGIQQLNSAMEDLKDTARAGVTPPIDEFAGGLAYDIRALQQGTREFNEEQIRNVERLASGLTGAYARVLDLVPFTDFTNDAALGFVNRIDPSIMSVEELAAAIERVAKVSPEAASVLMDAYLDKLNELQLAAAATATSVTEMVDSLDSLAEGGVYEISFTANTTEVDEALAEAEAKAEEALGSADTEEVTVTPKVEAPEFDLEAYTAQMEALLAESGLADMPQDLLIDAATTMDIEAVGEAFKEPMAAVGVVAAEDFRGAFEGLDWYGVGTTLGGSIKDGLKAKLEANDIAFTGIVKGLAMEAIREYLAGGGAVP